MANNDNAMTRFLFAILKQKNLKDIDWNMVAHDPILSQEITNGHAARMRYSRFRAAMLGLEPQRRNRTNPANKSRVTKSKKDSKAKKEGDGKYEPAADAARLQRTPEASSTRVKEETPMSSHESRLTPGPLPSVYPPTTPQVVQPRLLTPCSDVDAFAPCRNMGASPASGMMHPQNTLDFSGLSPGLPFAHEHPGWQPSPVYALDPTYDAFDEFSLGACEQHQHLHPQPGGLGGSTPLADHDHHDVEVKQERWDSPFC